MSVGYPLCEIRYRRDPNGMARVRVKPVAEKVSKNSIPYWRVAPIYALAAILKRSESGGQLQRLRRTGLRLRFIYRRRGPSLLVAEGRLNTKGRAVASRSKTGRGVVTAPIFLLVPQVKLPKRLDLARDAERAVDGVPGLIVANWVDGKLA